MAEEMIHISASKEHIITEQGKAYLVEKGEIEVFYQATDKKGQFTSSRFHLHTAKAGDLIMGLQTKDKTSDIKVELVSFDADIKAADLKKIPIASIERWVFFISQKILTNIAPRKYYRISESKKYKIPNNAPVYGHRQFHWMRFQKESLLLNGDKTHDISMLDCIPVYAQHWVLCINNKAEYEVNNTQEVIELGQLESILNSYQHFILNSLEKRLIKSDEKAEALIKLKQEQDGDALSSTLTELTKILKAEKPDEKWSEYDKDDAILTAIKLIGQKMEMKVVRPKTYEKDKRKRDPVLVIAKASKFRAREVILRGDWYKKENGHLLVFSQEDDRALALIQHGNRKYVVKDPVNKTSYPLTKEIAESLNPQAFMFFGPLDAKIEKIKDLGKYTWNIMKKDVEYLYILLSAITGSLLGLVSPIISALLFDDVIPQANKSYLLEVVLLMVALGLVNLCLSFFQNFLQTRVEIKASLKIQSAILDHLIRLPVNFFKNFTTGDLASRAMSMNSIQQQLSNKVYTGVLAGMFSVVNLFLLFYYAPSMAWLGIGLCVFSVGVDSFFSLHIMRYYRMIGGKGGIVSGKLLEILNGIGKIRVAGAEIRAFSQWAVLTQRMNTISYKMGYEKIFIGLFHSVYDLLTTIGFFYFIYYMVQTSIETGKPIEGITVGAFMAFISAFRQFQGRFAAMINVVIGVIQIVPMFERLVPILKAVPESNTLTEDPGELKGNIELNHIKFKYKKNGPLILNDVNMKIKAGEQVAFVGPSGSGKSTIMRLLIGFEKLQAGSILFDGMNYQTLDIDAVRKQFGVVLQHGQLLPGSIFQNIVGSSNLSLQEATEAANMAGMEDDINEMPMGMHTVLGAGSTLSGGQMQRLMIARAIVQKPRFLFFDEATSALDNRTQEIVTKSLEQFQATRIIVAHRLSTIMKVDRIFVIDKGKIVETGTYEELLNADGLFSQLAKRQIA